MNRQWEVFNPYNKTIYMVFKSWMPVYVVLWAANILERITGLPTDYARQGEGHNV